MWEVVYCQTASQILLCVEGMKYKSYTVSAGGARKSRNIKPDYHSKVPSDYIRGGSRSVSFVIALIEPTKLPYRKPTV